MKIEKIGKNKIKVLLNNEDFKDKNIDLKQVLSSKQDSQKLFLEILDAAERKVNFKADGYKLLIDSSIKNNNIFICTITKFRNENFSEIKANNKYNYKTMHFCFSNLTHPFLIYEFESLDNFFNFCDFLHNTNINFKGIYKKNLLYLHNSSYYLVLENVNSCSLNLKKLINILSEFAFKVINSDTIKLKLNEYSKIIIKNNAIEKSIKYFSKEQKGHD